MNLEILIFDILFLIFRIICNQLVVEPKWLIQEQYGTTKLKSMSISSHYYVSKTGNDKNSGTSSSPFLTIQKAADVVNPGDTVIIRNGTYTSNGTNLVNLSKGGSVGNYVVFMAENKWGAVLDGNETITTGINIGEGASYIKFINLVITRFRESGYNGNHSGYISQYITIQGNKIYDLGRFDTETPYGIDAIYLRKGNHHWTITQNLIYNIGRTGPDTYYMNKDHAVYTGTTDSLRNAAHHINITYNVIFAVSGALIMTGSNHDLIANNVFAWRNENRMGAGCFIAVDAGVTDLTIANNIFFQPPAVNPFALQAWAPFIGWSIKNNMVYGGSIWQSVDRNKIGISYGGNYCRTNCEKGEVDPKFVSGMKANAPKVDFRLLSTSPAINAGINVGLTTDFSGNPIIGLPDIGAYEYTNPNSPPINK